MPAPIEPAPVEPAPLRPRPRDVIDEMLAELATPSPDDEPTFAGPLPEPIPAATPPAATKPPGKTMKLVAMVLAGATLFVAGAGVALHVSRTQAAAVER